MARPLMERFLEKFEVDKKTKCWVWNAAISKKDGYGEIRGRAPECRQEKAHRVSYMLFRGPIPDGLMIDHVCRNRACVNPAHLELVTHQENCERAPRPDHCPNGHPFTPENTGVDGKKRYCRVCKRARYRRWYRSVGGRSDYMREWRARQPGSGQ